MKDDDGKPLFTDLKGEVELEMMMRKERTDLIQSMGLAEADDKTALAKLDDMEALVSKRAKRVDLEICGEKVTNLSDLGFYEEGGVAINNMFTVLMKGIPPMGEASRQP
jgi:hypothetical protein